MRRKVSVGVLRRRTLAGGVACAIALGAALSPSIAVSDKAPTLASNQAAAQSDAAYLLAELPLPPGATQSSTEPAGDGGTLAQPGTYEATPNLVKDHGWWVVPGSPGDVMSYIDAHRPSDSTLTFRGGGSGPNQPTVTTHGYAWAPVTGVLRSRWLVVSVVALDNGQAGMRADGEDVWITPRRTSERVPAGVRAVSITVQALGGPQSAPRIVRSPRAVKRIIALADSLPAFQPGGYACPNDSGPIVRVTFLGPAGSTLARLSADPGGCGGVFFWIGPDEQPVLSDAATLIDGLHQLGAVSPIRTRRP